MTEIEVVTQPPSPSSPATVPMTRYVPIDIMRAANMLYIVGFWHLFQYTKITIVYNPITFRMLIFVLALFVLISGFLLGHKNNCMTKTEILNFYKTRFLRIYIPFLIASGLFLEAGLNHPLDLLKNITLTAMFLAPAPFTLWFVSMIFLFYLITPLLISLRRNALAYIASCVLIVIAMFLYQLTMGRMDMQLIIYFPCFAAGLFMATRPFPSSLSSTIGLMVLTVVSLIPTLTLQSDKLAYNPWVAPWAFCGSITAFIAIMRAGQNLKPIPLVTWISEASFFMYLLHRLIYRLMRSLWFPSSEGWNIVYLLFICLPIVGVTAWLCQKGYNSLLQSRRA